MRDTMSMDTIHDINTRLFFSAGGEKYQPPEIRPWQFVQMEYTRMGLTSPEHIPVLETIEDAEIWMCLDERVNHSMRMHENARAV